MEGPLKTMGPLQGVRIIEFAGIGPCPFAAMMLADHGAEVIRIDRPGGTRGGVAVDETRDILLRSRKSVALDLKKPEAIAVLRDLVKSADGLLEGFRPGVMERLGLGPDVLLKDNPKLVYGRMTGWGQTGPYAQSAGHDINYIALAGNLHTYGRAGDRPTPPINMIGDFGGGGMMLAYGMVCAILNVRGGGQGQVIDCAMTEGAAVLASMIWSLYGLGLWQDRRGVNMLDTGAHFYDAYETSDGKWISIGAIEPQFYAELRRLTGLEADRDFDAQLDEAAWPKLKEKLTRLFKTKTRDEWCKLMEMTDVCFAPVLSLAEAPHHPHSAARGSFAEISGMMHPMPAPRYSKTQNAKPRAPCLAGADTDAILAGLGYDARKIASIRETGALGKA
jgi:alpha-methylacyl-CoA racemase